MRRMIHPLLERRDEVEPLRCQSQLLNYMAFPMKYHSRVRRVGKGGYLLGKGGAICNQEQTTEWEYDSAIGL